MLQALFTACVKEYSYITDPEKTIFNFSVSESQRQKINESRGIKFELTDPTPDLIAGGLRFRIDHFRIRGESTLNFERKCFSVNMDQKIPVVDPVTGIERKFERFKLISGVFDYTYIENRTAESVFRKIGLWPLFDFYTEVKLNTTPRVFTILSKILKLILLKTKTPHSYCEGAITTLSNHSFQTPWPFSQLLPIPQCLTGYILQ